MARFNQSDDLRAAEFIAAALPGARFVEADSYRYHSILARLDSHGADLEILQQSITAWQVPQTGWCKSSRSSAQADSNCVEVHTAFTGFQVRKRKLGDISPIFDLGTADFTGLLRVAGRDWHPNQTGPKRRARAVRSVSRG